MSWVRIALAALAGGIVSSMTDWLFMGDWLYGTIVIRKSGDIAVAREK